MHPSAAQVLRDYLAAQASGDAMSFVAEDAVFDVGRGRYEGPEVRGFLDRLRAVHSESRIVRIDEPAEGRATAVFEQRDDDLAPLGIDALHLDVEVTVTADGRIREFRARPTAESVAALAAARDAGRSSEGVRLAERAGTLPPPQPADVAHLTATEPGHARYWASWRNP